MAERKYTSAFRSTEVGRKEWGRRGEMLRLRAGPVVAVEVVWRWGSNSRREFAEKRRRFICPTADNHPCEHKPATANYHPDCGDHWTCAVGDGGRTRRRCESEARLDKFGHCARQAGSNGLA